MTPATPRRAGRLGQPRLLRRDWIGDAVLVLACGVVLLVSVFLPWVNEDGRGQVSFRLTQGGGLNGVLQTQWGVPALVVASVVLVAGLVMLVTRPRRFSLLLGVTVAVCGVAAFAVARDAAASVSWYDPGVGMYLTTLVAVLLVPIGLAAALVAGILMRAERTAPAGHAPTAGEAAAAPPTAPPAPESAPPS